ncbi:MAG: hypothetical protein PUH31_06185 [Prevotella stercorea]|uniref:hypothetical protein n=1 Tax=Leyella stercorea TaxID=363265 RepID=UPI002802D747|nr:hypothetical protein [Leyella stercorea]MDY5553161.1 hypothetical protein [Prevotella sp.]
MLTFAYITITPSQLHFIIKQISPPHHLNLTPHHLTISTSPPHHLTTSTSQLHHLNISHHFNIST